MSRETLLQTEIHRVDGAKIGTQFPKHVKMCTSPFVFYRGSSQLMYADIASKTIDLPSLNDVPLTTIMGDCHTSNFGFFTEGGSHGESLAFSINDFDDACIGHGMWDLFRLLVSFPLAQEHCQGVVEGRYVAEKDYSDKPVVSADNIKTAMQTLIDSYSLVLQRGVDGEETEGLHLEQKFDDFATPSPLKKRYKKAKRMLVGGEDFTTKSALAKAVDLSSDTLMFRNRADKFLRLSDDLAKEVTEAFAPYFFQDINDVVARQGSGTGSLSLGRYYVLVGPKQTGENVQLSQYHVVEIKQQRQSAPIHYFPDLHQQNRLNPAHLTVKCQRRIQRRIDYVLDEAYFQEKHWLIRSRHHSKVGFDPEHIAVGKTNAEQGGFVFYASACGQELARAHSRGDKFSVDYERAMLKYLTEHKSALIEKALEYFEQVKRDWAYLCEVEKV